MIAYTALWFVCATKLLNGYCAWCSPLLTVLLGVRPHYFLDAQQDEMNHYSSENARPPRGWVGEKTESEFLSEATVARLGLVIRLLSLSNLKNNCSTFVLAAQDSELLAVNLGDSGADGESDPGALGLGFSV